MFLILSESTNPYFNLACEEYLLRNKSEEVFMLWRSEPCVVIGKHQNTLAEINYKYIRENDIKVARRLSGGGTVVHDLQNINFTFIANGEAGKLIDFKRFVAPIIDYLDTLGIAAHIGEKNDIRIGELKISGNAEHIYKRRILHHGTLLFNSDLSRLKEAIKAVPKKYFDKAVQSNRATVTNIIGHLPNRLSIEEFELGLSHFISANNKIESYDFAENELAEINRLQITKYQTPDWIYGYSPKYRFEKQFKHQNMFWEVELFVEKGKISDGLIQVNGADNELITSLIGEEHRFDSLKIALRGIYPDYIESELNILTNSFF